MNGTPKGPRLTLHVTQEIIDHSIQVGQRDSKHCMMADALLVAFPDAKAISVDLATIRFTDPRRGLRFTYLTPRVGQVELVKFDQGIKPAPYSFQIRGAQVTRSGSSAKMRAASQATKKPQTPAQVAARAASMEKMTKQKIVNRDKAAGGVAERVGGKTPPLQTTSNDVPFSRRRAFGLRALEY